MNSSVSYYWPLAMILAANTLYHVCTKAAPEAVSPFVFLAITYTIAAAGAVLCYMLPCAGANAEAHSLHSLLLEVRHANWASVILGLSVLALEVGFIFMYRAGWNVNTGFTLSAAFEAVILLALGYALYDEPVSAHKLIGVALCVAGIYFLSQK